MTKMYWLVGGVIAIMAFAQFKDAQADNIAKHTAHAQYVCEQHNWSECNTQLNQLNAEFVCKDQAMTIDCKVELD